MKFLFPKLGQGLLVIWGIVTLMFIIFYALGNPTDYLVDEKADQATREATMARYGLDKPLIVQYGRYLNQLSPIGWVDSLLAKEVTHWPRFERESGPPLAFKAPYLGRSYISRVEVGQLIADRLPGTIVLALAAILLAAGLGISLGTVAALRYGSALDQSILSSSVLGISAPSFFVGVVVAYLFAVKFQDWTHLQFSGYIWEDNIFGAGKHLKLKNLLLPALALGVRPLAIFIQLTRSSLLDVLNSEYIRTAKAKGLSYGVVLVKHALRNALNPVLTAITSWLASLLAGAFFIEYIFNWQGIGKLMIDALTQNDYPVIIGCSLTIGIIFVLVNIVTDWLYQRLDPRVSYD